MMHPPPEQLRSYVDGKADITSRLLVDAHLTLCRRCSASVAAGRQTDDGFPDATFHDELDLPPFDQVWSAVQRATVDRQRAVTAVVPSSLLAALPPPSCWRWFMLWPDRVKLALLIRDVDTGSELYLCHLAPGARSRVTATSGWKRT